MVKIFLIFIIFSNSLLAYNTIEIKDQNIKIEEGLFYADKKELNYSAIMQEYHNKNFLKLPKNAFSFGFSKKNYWFAFKFSSNSNNELYLRVHKNIIQNATLYTFSDNKLLDVQHNGGIIPVDEKSIKQIPLYFELGSDTNEKFYLLKIQSKSPIIASFFVGSFNELEKQFNSELYLFIFLSGMLIIWIIYNSILYFITKEKSYIYYALYTFGSYLLVFFLLGYLPIVNDRLVSFTLLFITFSAQIKLIGLVLFTNNFLNLKSYSSRLIKLNFLLLFISCILLFFLPFAMYVSLLFPMIIYALFIYYGLIGLKRYFFPSLFYSLATGVALISYISFILMNDIGYAIEYSFFTSHLPLFGLAWDTIFLSIAISYKVKILHNEKEEYKKMLLIKSNIDSIGQLNANIIHQWKTPLSEIGSINTNLLAKVKYDTVHKDEIIDSLELIGNTLKELSKTTDSFYQQYSLKNGNSVLVTSILQEVHNLFVNSLKESGINLHLKLDQNIKVHVNQNTIFQILVILLTNAKEQFSKIDSPQKDIWLTLFAENKDAYIGVEDNAGGIKCNPIESIFEPYYSTKDQSSGLGLYIAKKLAQQSNIEINVKNRDKGVVFLLRFKKLDIKKT